MKTTHFLILAITGLSILSGCKKEDPAWEIENKNIIVPRYSDQCFIHILNGNLSLSAVVDAAAADWCTVTGIYSDNSTISSDGRNLAVNIALVVEANLIAEPRVAFVTISDNGRSETVTITQEAGDVIMSIDHTMIEHDYTAGMCSIPVTSNASWTAHIEAAATWCTLTAASGKGNGTITVNIPHETLFRRYTTVFINAGTARDSVMIFQHGEPVSDPGVNIGGVIWATRNVGDFGAFVLPYEAGKFYQFNRPVAYTSTDPLSPAWDNTYPKSGDWLLINDPCPDGWRLPSLSDYQILDDFGWHWVTADEGGPGTWFGPGAENASFYPTIPDDAVFFPAVGARVGSDGHFLSDRDYMYQWEGENGCYWSNKSEGSGSPPMLFGEGGVDTHNVNWGYWGRLQALSIRCVKR
jgi:uncharacterized protein (TIGR02145 family)